MEETHEATRLADALEISSNHGLRREAAAELRRLHAENQAMREERDKAWRTAHDAYELGTAMMAPREAMLEALKTVEWHGQGSCWVVDEDKIEAAIAAATKD